MNWLRGKYRFSRCTLPRKRGMGMEQGSHSRDQAWKPGVRWALAQSSEGTVSNDKPALRITSPRRFNRENFQEELTKQVSEKIHSGFLSKESGQFCNKRFSQNLTRIWGVLPLLSWLIWTLTIPLGVPRETHSERSDRRLLATKVLVNSSVNSCNRVFSRVVTSHKYSPLLILVSEWVENKMACGY